MIHVNNVSKQFKRPRKDRKEHGGSKFADAVHGVSFECIQGKTFGLIGPNGAGKTTLLRMIATMMQPTTGEITVCGMNSVKQSLEIRKKMGFLTTNTNLYEHMTSAETVKFYADINQVDQKLFKQRKDELFSLLGIHDFANKKIKGLSTGMKQKVNIARTLIHDPEILIMDEPTTGLDVMASKHITDLIQSSKRANRTVIFSTHRFNEVKLLCDDIAVMQQGKVIFNRSFSDFEETLSGDTLEEKFVTLLGETS